MADIIDLKTRKVTQASDDSIQLPECGLAIACQCTSTSFELRNGGGVVCSRCRRQINAKWDWLEMPNAG